MKKLAIPASLLILFTMAAFWQRTNLWSWYCVREMRQADDKDQALWVKRVSELDHNALARVLECLRSPEEAVGRRAEEVLLNWSRTWTWEESRSAGLLTDLYQGFPVFSLQGQRSALAAVTALCQRDEKTMPGCLARLAGQVLTQAEKLPALLPGTIRLAGVLSERAPEEPWYALCRQLIPRGLQSNEAECRSAAILLFLLPSLSSDRELLALISQRLHDPDSRVRRSALLVLGSQEQAVSTDDLLPLLHDDDPEVSQLCEVALRSRGVHGKHLLLARRISDSHPKARLEVLEYLAEETDLDAGVWLRKLSHDNEPAVRAAAVRFAAGQTVWDLRTRLREMVQADPSPTVRQVAGYYLSHNVWAGHP